MRAKFRCNTVIDHGQQETATLSAVTDDGTPENERYHTATPNGQLSITVSNPEVRGYFTPGMSYYIDFSEAAA